MVKLKDINGRISMDQRWTRFAISHHIKIGTSESSRHLRAISTRS
jgi:hypothetical protein